MKKKVPQDPFHMSKRKRLRRLRNSTTLNLCNGQGDSEKMRPELEESGASGVHQKETMEVTLAIHGGSIVNRKPAIDGLFITAVKKASHKDLIEYFENSKIYRNMSFQK